MAARLFVVQGTKLQQFASRPPLQGGSGGSTYDGMPPDLPERVAAVETHIDHINRNIGTIQQDVRDIRGDMKTDFRLTWAGLFVVAIGLAGMMAKGFKWF
jgi:hypothetical protein